METDSEAVYRSTTIVLLVAGWGIRTWFQRKALGAERVSARSERRERFLYRLVFVSFLFPFVYALSRAIDFAHVPLPAMLRWAGAAVIVAATALLVWTHIHLGRNWSGVLEIHRDHSLVTDGPYRFVRHPMYSAFYLLGVGLVLLTANAMVGLLILGATTVMYAARHRDEEAMMVDQFGDEYRAYMQRTGRLVPRLRA